jgi:hypothetical protein
MTWVLIGAGLAVLPLLFLREFWVALAGVAALALLVFMGGGAMLGQTATVAIGGLIIVGVLHVLFGKASKASPPPAARTEATARPD